MPVFVVISDEPNPLLGDKIAKLYPAPASYKMNDRNWLVSAEILTQALGEALDVRTGKLGRVLIVRASNSAAGWYSKSLWEWMNLQDEKT